MKKKLKPLYFSGRKVLLLNLEKIGLYELKGECLIASRLIVLFELFNVTKDRNARYDELTKASGVK